MHEYAKYYCLKINNQKGISHYGVYFLTQSVGNLAFTHSHNMHNLWLNFKKNERNNNVVLHLTF
ncbi:hypothetical protein D7V21_13970 [Acinetobacter guerrae]|uniref:Uncharacterized protein n=1 Tax=Acinetobacter guerrae TaxID=1843371 RepID=A0A3A8EB00_9GAMM|nr:hypothetical protein D7V21_13970 [Acinetobacter guerrae]